MRHTQGQISDRPSGRVSQRKDLKDEKVEGATVQKQSAEAAVHAEIWRWYSKEVGLAGMRGQGGGKGMRAS